MPRNRNRNRARTAANDAERRVGIQGQTSAQAQDMFTNAMARLGFGTPNLGNGAEYELVRLSYDYWKLITLFRNHWISRRIVEVPAQDMVKAWPKLTSDIDPADLTKIDRAIRRTNTKQNVLTGLTWGRLFGGGGGLLAIKGHENRLDEPLDLEEVGLGAYQGIIPFDRWAGISPSGSICTDISRPLDFNKPEMYEVRTTGGSSFQVHSSRLLRFLGPTVPAPELEAQSYWGISVLEPIYESITKLDNMSGNILALTFRANILGMKIPDLAQMLSGVGASQQAAMRFENRMTQLNHMISNQSLVPLPAEGSIESTSYAFGGLADIFQLFQLDLSGASQIPVSRLWGRTYNGLGQAGDADERIYEEKINTDQQTYLAPQLEKLYPVICMSEIGAVPDDLDLIFPSIRVLDEKEKSELAKTVMDTVVVALNAGIMSQRTAGREIKQSSDVTGIGTNLTDEAIEKLSDEPQSEGELGEGLFGGAGGGLEPASSPTKVGKEETKGASASKVKQAPDDDDEDEDEDANEDDEDIKPVGKDKPKKKPASKDRKDIKPVGKEDPKPEPKKAKAKDYVLGRMLSYFTGRAKAQATDSDGPATDTKSSKGMMLYHALPVAIETPAGEKRSGITPEGKPWSVSMPADYGFIEGFVGADGDSLDCYVGTCPESDRVFVVDQYDLAGKHFDEHKVVLGVWTRETALDVYASGHHKSDVTFAACTEFAMPMFRRWLASADLTKPCDPKVRL